MAERVIERLRRLDEDKNFDRRGAKFEGILAEAFETAGYLVQSNDTSTASGRECDLVASNNRHTFIVEAKWKLKPVEVGALDSLKIRLDQAPRGAIGCFFSRSGFQRGFLDAVQSWNHHHILLFEGREILHVLGSPTSLNDALDDKLQEARRRADRAGIEPTITPVPGAKGFGPSRQIRLRVLGREVRRLYLGSKGGFTATPALFAREWGDPLWESSCELQASAFDLGGLGQVFRLLRRTHHLALDGAFAIYGLQGIWTGFGIGNLLAALREGDRRYEVESVARRHHSEEFIYLATANCGSASVAGRRHLDGRESIDSVRVRFQLPGIPADAGKFDELRRKLKATDCYFTNRDPALHSHVKMPGRQRLEVIGDVVDKSSDGGCDIGGIVVRNPFRKGRRLPKFEGEPASSASELLRTAETLVCDLRDWHDDGDVADYYYLTEIHLERIAGVVAVRPRATWNELKRRVTEYPRRSPRAVSTRWKKNRAFEKALESSGSHTRRPKGDHG